MEILVAISLSTFIRARLVIIWNNLEKLIGFPEMTVLSPDSHVDIRNSIFTKDWKRIHITEHIMT